MRRCRCINSQRTCKIAVFNRSIGTVSADTSNIIHALNRSPIIAVCYRSATVSADTANIGFTAYTAVCNADILNRTRAVERAEKTELLSTSVIFGNVEIAYYMILSVKGTLIIVNRRPASQAAAANRRHINIRGKLSIHGSVTTVHLLCKPLEL